jgi:hypothetical protein
MTKFVISSTDAEGVSVPLPGGGIAAAEEDWQCPDLMLVVELCRDGGEIRKPSSPMWGCAER